MAKKNKKNSELIVLVFVLLTMAIVLFELVNNALAQLVG